MEESLRTVTCRSLVDVCENFLPHKALRQPGNPINSDPRDRKTTTVITYFRAGFLYHDSYWRSHLPFPFLPLRPQCPSPAELSSQSSLPDRKSSLSIFTRRPALPETAPFTRRPGTSGPSKVKPLVTLAQRWLAARADREGAITERGGFCVDRRKPVGWGVWGLRGAVVEGVDWDAGYRLFFPCYPHIGILGRREASGGRTQQRGNPYHL